KAAFPWRAWSRRSSRSLSSASSWTGRWPHPDPCRPEAGRGCPLPRYLGRCLRDGGPDAWTNVKDSATCGESTARDRGADELLVAVEREDRQLHAAKVRQRGGRSTAAGGVRMS